MNAIRFTSGMMAVCGLEYTDGRTTRLCTISGNPLEFNEPYFEEVRHGNQTDNAETGE